MYAAAIVSLLAAGTAALPFEDLAAAIKARAPSAANPVLKNVSSTGTGCAPNSAAFLFVEAASVAFDAMLLSSETTARTKNCLITVSIGLDPGWKVTVNSGTTNFQGYSFVPTGLNPTVSVKYGSNGVSNTATGTVPFISGGGEYNVAPAFASPGAVSSPCGGGVVTIESKLTVANTSSTFMVTIDSQDIAFSYSQC